MPGLKSSIFSSAGSETGVSPCLSAPFAIECARTTTIDFCRGPTADTRHPKRQAENIVYTHPFSYHRAGSVLESSKLLQQLGEEARLIAGGQSLIPLMKMRMARPSALVDINFIPGLSEIRRSDGQLRFGALARHADIEASDAASSIPIVHDCAAGIADVQVRNQGTIGGSLAEADPSGDWGAVLLALDTSVRCSRPSGERTIALDDFFKDAYTTALGHDELISEIIVKQAEKTLRGEKLEAKRIESAVEAVRAAAEPQDDMRGSADYKRVLIAALVKRAIGIAARRARGEQVEAGHEYAGR